MKYCLIGYPINRSLSPYIHKRIGEMTNTEIDYCLEEKKEFSCEYLKERYNGFNVTVPFKEKIIPFLDRTEKEAENAGSVNTVKFENGQLTGYSTDGRGFITDFRLKTNSDFTGKKVCILGTGGAEKALSYEIRKENPEYIIYFSKSRKGKNIFSYEEKSMAKECDIIINTAPVGLYDSISLLEYEDFRKDQTVYDLIYGKKTEFLCLAEKAGAKIIGGLGMLVWQAVLSEEIWQNIKIDENVSRNIIGELAEIYEKTDT